MKQENLATWRDKLHPVGLEYLDEYRRQKLHAQAAERKQSPINFLNEIDSRINATSQRSDEDKEFLDVLKAANPEAAKAFHESLRDAKSALLTISVPELWQYFSDTLELTGPQGRKGIAFMLALLASGFLENYRSVRRRHFGDAEITDRQFSWVLGTTLVTIGNTFRTGDSTPTTKGRVNVELVDMVRAIRKHEEKRLRFRELKDALEYVLIHVADEGSLRLQVHRAKKRGLL